MKKALYLLLLFCPLIGQAQRIDSSASNTMLFNAGRELLAYRELQTASVAASVVGGIFIGANAYSLSERPDGKSYGYYIGGGMVLTGIVLSVLSHHRVGNAGLYLQMASGRVPLRVFKRYASARKQADY